MFVHVVFQRGQKKNNHDIIYGKFGESASVSLKVQSNCKIFFYILTLNIWTNKNLSFKSTGVHLK